MAEEEEQIINLPDNLELVLDELDDKEFDIPAVKNPPTLESILNEPDDDSPIQEDELVPAEMLQGDQAETASISSAEGILEGKPKRKNRKHIRYDQHGAILRHVVLKGVSGQIISASDRVDAGMPTAMAVSTVIAVGTSHGLVLVFDPKQVLKWCLGSTAVGAQYGAVSALSFNKDCSRLLSGFARGQITMWDLTNGKLLRTITDVHPPGTAILHVKFTDDLTLAVCSDSGGSVFELEFKRLIGVRTCESKCLFSGSRGEVCTIEPLHMHHTIQDHPMKDVIVLAMASLSKVLIVTVRPQLKVIYMHPLKGDAATLPLLAWQFVIIQVSESNRTIDPVLAFARDQSIHFAQVICSGADDIKVAPLQKTDLPYKLLALTWMNSRTMVVIDTSERAHVIDVRTEEELEVVDLADVQLVYSTSFYKSLATGGNVSQALAYAGERACYQSICSFNQQLILLGTKGIHCMNIRPWRERVDVLVRQNQFPEALALAGSFYDGKARAVVGLYGGIYKRRKMVAEKILSILESYVDLAVTVLCPKHGKMEELEEYYQIVVPICVDNCLKLDRTDILFGTICDKFSSDPIAKGTFLECLEPYIINDRLTSMSPSVMQEFVAHYQSHNMLQNVEACIVHLDIASLDIHQIVLLCWANGLYDAILYIYNRGMLDYTTPLEELLLKLRLAVKSVKQLTDDQIKLGNKLLVYISCCLAGRAYPFGDIPQDQVETVKEEVFKCVTCLHTKDADDDEPAYPHLKTLLTYDTREFFNVLALAFEEPEFRTEDGIEKRQRIVDILLQIMVESIGFTPTQIGILFTFLARQMARNDNTIMVPRTLFEQVLESLCSQSEDSSRHEERQQALIELLQAGGLAHFDENKLLKLAEQAEFFRVCEMLYEKRREYDKILSCYWRDSARKHQAFSYIKTIMQNPEFTMMDRAKIQKEALAHLKELVSIDSRRTSQLVLVHLASSLTEVVSGLQHDEDVLFKFLSAVFDPKDNNGDRAYQIEPHIHEMYIELLCKNCPESVFSYLKVADGYGPEETLEICRKYKLSEPTAYLLEKSGDIQGAFTIMLENIRSQVTDLLSEILAEPSKSKQDDEQDINNLWGGVYTTADSIIELCQRNSGKMDEVQRQSLWFPFLDVVMSPQRQLRVQTEAPAFKDLTRHILNSMMSYISLPAILTKIMQDPTYSTGKFGEIKDLLLGMLDTYNYEKTLLHTCNNLVNHDLHQQLAALTQTASRGTIPRSQRCMLCGKAYLSGAGDVDTVVCFRCGHGYHLPCLKTTGSCVRVEGEETWLCYICNKTKRGRLTGNMRTQRLPSTGTASIMQNSKTQRKPVKQSILDPEQIQSLDNLRRVQKTPSRLAILTELARHERGGSPSHYKPQSSSILQNEHFHLRVAHPPPNFQ